MKILITALAFTLLSTTAIAGKHNELKPLKIAQYTTVGYVELDGKRYQKVVSNHQLSSLRKTAKSIGVSNNFGLFKNDMIQRGELALLEKVSGNFFISGKNGLFLQSIVDEYNLDIVYSKGNVAIVTAPQGKELISLLNSLRADKRISVANLEKVANKMHPE